MIKKIYEAVIRNASRLRKEDVSLLFMMTTVPKDLCSLSSGYTFSGKKDDLTDA